MRIAVIDYGAGNVQSVRNAFSRLGIKAVLTANAKEICSADRIVFPGNGHAKSAVKSLIESGIWEVLSSLTQPVLGICLGMQLMCNRTEEGCVEGLRLFPMEVKRFSDNVRVPQIGWNTVSSSGSRLLAGLVKQSYFYFLHSYFVEVGSGTSGLADYSERFSAVIEHNNFFGCQFHPEKSGEAGEQFLRNFVNL